VSKSAFPKPVSWPCEAEVHEAVMLFEEWCAKRSYSEAQIVSYFAVIIISVGNIRPLSAIQATILQPSSRPVLPPPSATMAPKYPIGAWMHSCQRHAILGQ
jgi:hypothetical protein